MLHNPNVTDDIAKWATELAGFELDFIVCHAIKSQVLADFVADWTSPPSHSRGSDDNTLKPPASVFTSPHWTLFFDGSLRKQGGRRGSPAPYSRR
jgi:hypothetical protein